MIKNDKKIQLKLYIFLTMLGIFTSYNAQSWVIWDNLGDGTTAGASTIGVGSATSNPITGKVTVVPSLVQPRVNLISFLQVLG